MPYPDGAAAEIYRLYETAWPGLPANIGRAAALGWHWDRISTPFGVRADGQLVSHVGVLEYDLLFDGERTPVAGIHAVCTHPDHRGRGYARQALERAMAHVDERGLPAVLETDKPAVYWPHGFRPVPEHRWSIGATGPQRLATSAVTDPGAVDRIVAARTPLSLRRGTLAPSWLFGINAVLARGDLGLLHWIDAIDTLIATATDADGTIRLLDVVAAELPDLETVLDALPEAPDVVLCFHPDRFPGTLDRARPRPLPMGDVWMVRGLDLEPGLGQIPVLSRH